MLLLFLFVLLFLCVCVCVCFFCLFVFLTRDRNMISIGTVEFRHYVVTIIPVNLGKP